MAAVIFNGPYAKVLAANGIKLKDDTLIMHGSIDPSVVNPTAPNGSVYLSTLGLYVRISGAWSKLDSPELDPDYLDIETWTKTTLASANIVNNGCTISNAGVINGANSLQANHALSVTTLSLKKTIAVPNKFRGKNITMSLWSKSTATTGNVTVLFRDETGAANIGVSQQVQLSSSIIETRLSFDMPANCASMSYTISFLPEAGSKVTNVDDIQMYLTSQALSSTSVTVPKAISNESEAIINNNGTVSITSNTGNIIASASFVSTGVIQINFQGLTNTPSIVATGVRSNAAICSILSVSSSSAQIRTTDDTNGVVNIPIHVKVTKQGTDYIDPTTSTETKTIPLTSSVLVTQPDSAVRLFGGNGFGSTNTQVRRFTNLTDNLGSDVTYNDSPTLGASFTINSSGLYDISYTEHQGGGNADFTIQKNSTSLGVTSNTLAYGFVGSSVGAETASAQVYLNKGDVIYALVSVPANVTSVSTVARFSISKVGSTKILNPSSDQKVEIPTHELRFEGASSRGTTDTVVVKFDTLAKIKGDGFTVTNTAANGTVITIRKKGKLSVSASIKVSASADYLKITKNQATLTAVSSTPSEIMIEDRCMDINGKATAASTFDVDVGDIIRVTASSVPVTDAGNNFTLSLQEQSVAVALQNVAPRWDDSDSAVRVQGGNGFGSTNTLVRRMSNVLDNFGSAIEYQDSATLGASFLIKESGLYNISYSDQANAGTNIAIVKNSINFTPSPSVLAIQTSPAATYANACVEAYLLKGDVIRPIIEIPANIASTNGLTEFLITKVGKTQGTVDVTPFVQIPQNETDFIEQTTSTINSWGSTATGMPVLSLSTNTNKGILQVISDSVNGTYFRCLKECEVDFNVGFRATAAGENLFIMKNSANTTIGVPTGTRLGFATSKVANYTSFISGSTRLLPNDTLKIIRASSAIQDIDAVTITATAISPSVATSTQQVSSDTMNFVFKSTAIVDSDPVGTYNTFAYSANSNAATITASNQTTQTSASMNIDGIQIFGRAFNANSVAGQPSRIDIKIGKGLKSKQVDGYAGTLKTIPFAYDLVTNGSTAQYGTTVTYNEITGILTLNAAACYLSSNTTMFVGQRSDNASLITSGYFVFNASQSPSLVSIPNLQMRVAYIKDVKASGVDAGASSAGVWQTRTLNTMQDSTGLVISLASNQFTLPAGTYDFEASAPAYGVNRHIIRLYSVSDSVAALTGSSMYASQADGGCCLTELSGEVTITSSKTFRIDHYTQLAQPTNGLGTNSSSGANETYTQVKITKIR